MTDSLTVPVGVIVVREKGSHPWEAYRWRTVRVMLDPIEKFDWQGFEAGASRRRHFHVATLQLVLQRDEAISYRVNLANGEPSVYVVLRQETSAKRTAAVDVRAVTVSPFAARSHGDPSLDRVDRVAMPQRLVTLLESFVASSPVDDAGGATLGLDASEAAPGGGGSFG
ncbi:MAG: DUF3305 domain-containing protein [Hyphomicrobiaceae bacterium]